MEVKCLVHYLEWLQKGKQELLEAVDFVPVNNATEIFNWQIIVILFHLLFKGRPNRSIEKLVQTGDTAQGNVVHQHIVRVIV